MSGNTPGGIFNNLDPSGQSTPFDATQSMTGVQESGLNNMNQAGQLIGQGANTLNTALGQEQPAANTMNQGVGTLNQSLGTANTGLNTLNSSLGTANTGINTINQAGGLQNQAIGGVNANQGAVQGTANAATSQINNILAGNNLSPSSNPYLKQMSDAANQTTIDQYREAIAPGLAAQSTQAYGGPGAQQSSAFQETQANNEKVLGQTLANENANIYGQNYANAQNQITSALGQVQGVQGSQFTGQNEQLTAAQNLLNTGQSQLGAANTQAGIGGQQLGGAATQADIGTQQVGAGANQLGIANTTANIGNSQVNAGNTGVNAAATQFGAGTQQYNQQNQGIDQLLGIGTLQQQQQQTGLNASTQNSTQANQYPMSMLSQAGNLLGQATGNAGNQVSVGTQTK